MAAGLKIFKREVRKILVARCVRCHGGEDTESAFELTTRERLLAGGEDGPVVVLGNGKASRLYKLIAHAEKPAMPADGAKLNKHAVAAIANWIDLGAPYDKPLISDDDDPLAWTRREIDVAAREFWSFQPLRKNGLPQTQSTDWIRTDIDRFVLAKLEEHKLQPNPEADRRTLVRRAYFDLIGLPPTPEEVQVYFDDKSPEAFANLLDRILESPHYGERWGRHWLDVARFGESHGFEQDYDRPHAFHYRDFVIKALNADMPFDKFVHWQLAGDEFQPDDPLAMMATGFLGAGVFPTQLTEKEFEPARYDELDDMAATVGTAMLGLTIGCARCHDHKFDPIPQADYYRLISSFTTTIRSDIDLNLDSDNISGALKEWEGQHQPLVAALHDFAQKQLPDRFEKWLESVRLRKTEPQQSTWTILDLVETKSTGGATFQKLDDGSVLASGTNANSDSYTFTAHVHWQPLTAIRLEALSHASMVKGGPGRASNGNFGLGEIRASVILLDDSNKTIDLKLINPRVTFQQNSANLSIAASIDGNKRTGWAVDPQFGKDHAAVFDIDPASASGIPTNTIVKLNIAMDFEVNTQHTIGRPRLSVTSTKSPAPLDAPSQPQSIEAAVRQLAQESSTKELNEKQREILFSWFRTSDAEWAKLNKRIQDHLAKKPQPQLTKVMVTSEGFKPIKHHADGRGFPHFYKETHFLSRGDATQKQGVAQQSFLQVLMTAPEKESRWQVEPPQDWRTSYRRRALANWITDTEYGAGHLLARVIVNRLWQHHMGRGIVSTPNDFGFQGQRPTHPELLDWLANELIRNGWRLKPIHKLIMSSSVYMQTSQYEEQRASVDPENHWYWRNSPRRLEAEIIRDSMLAVSGQLDRTMFGAGTLDEGMKRRSIYFMIKRSKLVPMMQIFDMPEPLVSQGARPTTTIAPQALLFMNNSHVRAWTSSFASRLKPAADNSLRDAVNQGYQLALARDPDETERTATLQFLEKQINSYEADNKSNARELALTDFCQVLLSLNEFVFVE
jgi:cytochrome c553